MPLSPRMPDLAGLEVLLAVARTGSLGAAAREIGTSQQAVSARISSLEARTGVPLVVRGRRGSELTPNGALVVQWATRLLEVAAELDEGLAGLRADRRSRLRVGASLTVAEHLLPGWLVALRQETLRRGQGPVDFVFAAANSDAVIAQVRAGEMDLGFIEGPRAPAGLAHRVIGRDELVVVVRPDHAWARRGSPLTPGELAAVSLVTREAGSGTRESFDSALAAARGPGQPAPAPSALEFSTTAAVRAAVLAGAGPAVLSELAVAEDLAAGRLRRVPVTGLDLARALRAIWLGPRRPPAGPVRDLISLAARD
ncbi:MAG TPA: LysR family transcriptional regulator [Actinospica sp.]|nr:LysR family transcriptional regulator [Actinospica sp.]